MSAIEALYVFDEQNDPLLEHTYRGRPPPGHVLLPLYLSTPVPRPSLIYFPSTNPPTLLYSIIQDNLLFLSPSSTDTEPLQVLEFLHRVADVLEDFLGSPLLGSRIEGNYDTVAQLLSEMVDGGIIASTEPNALRDVVEAPSTIKNLLGSVGLPSSAPSLAQSAAPFSLSSRSSPRLGPTVANAPSPVPWRRANVRHTSNEMYVDIVETLSVTLAPSGRPLSALANGTIAFTSKVSGIPDLLLQLGCPGGISNTVSLPVFHPSVRLGRWKERPGELSFVPPDGRFVLAGYEVDLLGSAALDSFSTSNNKASSPKLNIPGTASISTSLGPSGADFEVRLQLNPRFSGKQVSQPPSATGPSFPSSRGLGRGLGGSSAFGGAQGTTAAPVIEEMSVNIPLPASVKNVSDLRIRGPGDAVYAPGGRSIEWKINSREISTLMGSDRGSGNGVTATLRGTVVGLDSDSDEVDGGPVAMAGNPYEYEDEASPSSYQTPSSSSRLKEMDGDWEKRRMKLNKVLMPSCATVSFKVKGWLASGIKVEGLSLDVKKSKGLGAGVTPYKGVKYLCVSERGVESRC